MIKGFTGEYYNNHPVFIRSEYEYYHSNMSIEDRIGELTNNWYSDYRIAINDLYNKDLLYLLYRKYTNDLDFRLRRGECNYINLWHKYKNGYCHEVTGEYVEGYRPTRDSLPCWAKGIAGVGNNSWLDTVALLLNIIGL